MGLKSGVMALTAGRYHTCALTSVGGVKCWGYNWYGQLGDGTTEERSTPVEVVGLASGVTAIAGGNSHTCALTTNGGVRCWGSNYYGQLGDGTTVLRGTPVGAVGLESGVTAIAAGDYHACALTSVGGVKCWGVNDCGQLGDGTTTMRTRPVSVVGLSRGVAAIATGSTHTCGLTMGGRARCWGYDGVGALGNGARIYSATPVSLLRHVMYLPFARGESG